MGKWQEGTLTANGINMHYWRTGGDKTPMIMAHGLTDNGLAWSRLAHELEPFFDLIMLDARGHGLSDKPETGYSPEDHARDYAGAIDALGLDRPFIIGHSMGGVTAATICAEHPGLVRAAILEDPVWRWPNAAGNSEASKRAAYEDWKSRVEHRKTLSPEESFARGRRERPRWSVVDHDSDIQAKEQVALQALEYILEHEHTWMDQVPKFEVPVLLIYGNRELGSIVGPDVAAEAHRLNPLVEPVQVSTAGHSIRRESYEPYVAAVREFLAQVLR